MHELAVAQALIEQGHIGPIRQLGFERLQHMNADAFVGKQGVADAEHEHFHCFNLSARCSNNNQVNRSSI